MSATPIGARGVRSDVALRARLTTREVLLVIEGIFDLAAAMRTAAAVRVRAPSARVTVDLRRARIEDAALAAFVRDLSRRAIAIRGLSRHHERLLRYLEDAGAERRPQQ